MTETNLIDANDIAVVGMAGAFPESENKEAFWNMLLQGKSGIRDISTDELEAAGIDKSVYFNRDYVARGTAVPGAKTFDATFFGYTYAEAELMDPQHRIFLEHAWAALEDAGYIPDEIEDVVGVYAGCSMNRYLLNNLDINTRSFDVSDFQKMLASEKDFLSTRVSYKLNLRGPSINVQSACSTSLVAAQLGVLSLQTYQCDVALCGGVTVNVPNGAGYRYSEGLIYSPDGYCRPFSRNANGTVFGEGVGAVVLKRLADAVEDDDFIYAVIKGAAVNNDGHDKVGYTAPSVQGQAEVISLAHELSGIEAGEVDFIETHGTGTHLGDPIELAGLKSAFRDAEYEQPYCALGTLKASIGHLDAAAGVAALIKSVLVCHHRLIPPVSVASEDDFPVIEEEKTPFYFNHDAVDLSDRDRVVAGVSAFGVGGTNAHVIVASAPEGLRTPPAQLKQEALILMSGRTEEAATGYISRVQEWVTEHPEQLSDVAYTLYQHRKRFDYRSYLVAERSDDQALRLSQARSAYSAVENPRVAFLFPGQGSQYAGMGAELYHSNAVYRNHFDECISLLKGVTDKDIRSIILGQADDPKAINETDVTQLSLFIVEYSLARLYMSYGVEPVVMMGHSLGEYVAACVAGVFSLKDALKIVHRRGSLMVKTDRGMMLAVFTSRAQAETYLSGSLAVSVENSAHNVVISGTEEDIHTLMDTLESEQIRFSKLATRHPFHSRFMDPVLDAFAEAFEGVTLKPPVIPVLSATPDAAGMDQSSVRYWIEHLRREVNFHQAVNDQLLQQSLNAALEIGPGSALCSFVQSSTNWLGNFMLISSLPGYGKKKSVVPAYYESLAGLWCAGVNIDFEAAGIIEKGHRVPAPTYPFAKKEHWLQPLTGRTGRQAVPVAARVETVRPREWDHECILSTTRRCWIETFGDPDVGDDANFFESGGDSLLNVRLVSLLSKEFGTEVNSGDLIAHPSIRSMSDLLSYSLVSKGNPVASPDNLFRVDKRGNGKPLFLVGGAHEDRYFDGVKNKTSYEEDFYRYFSNFVKYLDGQRPVYGFKPSGLKLGEKMHETVEEMATVYIEQIRREQPEGPYYIGGECVGGIVAYEMARQLKESGDEVAFLLLMDTPKPGRKFHFTETSIVKARRIKRSLKKLGHDLRHRSFRHFMHTLGNTLDGALTYVLPYSASRKQIKNIRFGSQKYLDILLSYRPDQVDVPGILLINNDWWSKRGSLGWEKHNMPNVVIMPTEGDHRTRLTDYGHDLGKKINAALEAE